MQDLVAKDRAGDMVMAALPGLKQAAEAKPAEPERPDEKPEEQPEKAEEKVVGEAVREGVTQADGALDAAGGRETEEKMTAGRLAGSSQLRGSPTLAFGSRTQVLPEMVSSVATSKSALVAGLLSVCVFAGAFMLWQSSHSRHPR